MEADSLLTDEITGTEVRQFSIFLQNYAGSLLNIVKLLNNEHVEVIGISAQDAADSTVVRMVVSDAQTVEILFASNHIAHSSAPIIALELPGGAASLHECLKTLLAAEVNVDFMYPLLSRPSGKAVLAFHCDDMDFTRQFLMTHGYKVLCEEDLSR